MGRNSSSKIQLALQSNLPFVALRIGYRGQSVLITNVLVDTGSAGTILSADYAAQVQIYPEPDDELQVIRGVGGVEAVYVRQINYIELGGCKFNSFNVEIGSMDYGFEINGILGMDFLRRAKARINLEQLQLELHCE